MVGSASNGDGAFAYGTAGGKVTIIQNTGLNLGVVLTSNNQGQSINNQGQALLQGWGPAGLSHTIIQNPDGSTVVVPHPPGQSWVTGTAINNSGQVAGYTGEYGVSAIASLYSQGVWHSLGTLPGNTGSMAFALNNSGQVVGVSQGPNGSQAFLYSNGTMLGLGTLGGNYSAAQGINASGEIYG